MSEFYTPVGAEEFDPGKIIQVDIDKEMRKSFLDYSMSVIVDRALPDVRDGLKPVHRRILYAASEAGLTYDKPYRKSATIVGDVLGSYHPHGDASVYDAMVRLAQRFSTRYPLIDGHGNFGSVDGDPPAAYRYTEARMSRLAGHMLTDIEKDTVDWNSNYDDSKKEPAALPSRFPNLLVNGSVGIAVGMATNIPPHNLREVSAAVCHLIDNPEATLDELMQYVQGPDFPTGGIIMGRAGIRAAYSTGRGKLTLRSKTEFEEMKNGRTRIVVTEIPYMVNKARVIENIADLVKEKRIENISDLRDESDRDGMRIVVELKKEANPQVVLNQLFSYTQLQDTVGVIMLALVDGIPRVLTLKQMLEEYLRFQFSVVTRRTAYDLRKAKEREHILEGLKIVCDRTDEVIHIIRHSKDKNDSKQNLMERFGITDIQANAIVTMQLGQLSGMERIKIEDELASILERVSDYEDILKTPSRVYEIIRAELTAISDKYGDDRRTDIQAISGEMDIEDLIPETDSVITLTHYGYIKRQPADVYRIQNRGGRGISGMSRREEDYVQDVFVASTHDYIFFFTDRGRMYRIKGYEIPETSRASRGNNVINILPIEQNEKVTAMIRVPELDESGYLVMVTRNGTIKRTAISAYKNMRRGGIIAINLDDGDELAWVRNTTGENELLIGTARGMAIRFNENDLRPMGRNAMGVRAVRLAENDSVVGMATVSEEELLLTVSEKGLARRTPFSEYRLQSRGGKGVRNYDCAGRDTLVAAIRAVSDADDVIIISDDGVIIRIPVEQIATQSRYGGGVRAMRVAEGGRVVSIARAPHDDGEETDSISPEDMAAAAAEGDAPPEEPDTAEAAESEADAAGTEDTEE